MSQTELNRKTNRKSETFSMISCRRIAYQMHLCVCMYGIQKNAGHDKTKTKRPTQKKNEKTKYTNAQMDEWMNGTNR